MKDKDFDAIKNSLKTLKRLERFGITYRVLGTILLAAINGSPHRKIGDIDLLLDIDNKKLVFSTLKNEGFKITKLKKFGFSWYETTKSEHIPFTFLLIGRFEKAFFSYYVNSFIELRISKKYIRPYKYSLFNTEFVGIPPRSVWEGIRTSNLNPKRKLDEETFESKFKTIPRGITLEDGIMIYVFSVRIPKLYKIFSYLYNIYGGVRVIFGKKYEIW